MPNGEIPDGDPSEWEAVAPIDDAPTVVELTPPDGASRPSAAASPLRFVPGTIIGNRFRIIAALGRGGMGEVYRAEDLRLRQSVALKFLPTSQAKDRDRIEHLLQEVRLARQVAHPNVCRVYDFVDTGTEQFVAMEYVDGETLGALLRRVGRLPPKGAIGIAHQIVRGLAAVHEEGVLHRDLKPDNVMVDGRGHAHLMDFGIASLSKTVGRVTSALDLMGTPAYMAPEQLLGGPASSRTDVYALGVLLFQLATGQLPAIGQTLDDLIRQKADDEPPRPSTVVPDIDPAFEALILRCLDKDPAMRPVSGRAVAQALPGGDALEVALAAGDTPDREVVAAAQDAGALTRGRAWLAFGATFVALATFAWLLPETSLLGQLKDARPSGALAERGRQVLRELGWRSRDDSSYAFGVDWSRYHAIGRTDHSPQRWREALRGSSPLYLCYSEASRPEGTVGGPVAAAYVLVDHTGRLVELRAMPAVSPPGLAGPTLWRRLFELAGLDLAAYREVPPRTAPGMDYDQMLAWQGPFPGDPSLEIRVSAASLGGRLAFFRMSRASESEGLEAAFTDSMRLGRNVEALLLLLPFFAAIWLAVHHLRLGRADRQGSQRLALAYVALGILGQFLRGVPLVGMAPGVVLAAPGLGPVLVIGGFTWVLYLAAEPYVRRRWPRTLVGWARLVGGRFSDPLVGRDVLLGVLVGASACVLLALIRLPAIGAIMPPLPPFMPDGQSLVSVPALVAAIVDSAMKSVAFAFVVLVALVLLRSAVHSEQVAVVIALLAVLVPHALYVGDKPAVFIGVHFLVFFSSTVLIRRAGLLAFAVFYFTYSVLVGLASCADPRLWAGRHGLIAITVLLALALFGLVTSLGRRLSVRAVTTLG